MGRVSAPYGVRGWIKVKAFTEMPEALIDYPVWWLATRSGGTTQHRVLEARLHSDYVVARLEGLDSREQAATFRGVDVCVPRDQLPEPGDNEVYWTDLEGCDVVDRSGKRLGKVVEVQGSVAHPMLRVAGAPGGDGGEGRDLLIPFVPYVLGVDLEANRIDVDWNADD